MSGHDPARTRAPACPPRFAPDFIMAVALPVRIDARRRSAPMRGEVWIRYGAAYLSTLIAIAAESSAPGMSSSFIWALVLMTLLGLPVSLALRFSDLRIGKREIPRLAIGTFWSSLATLGILFLVIDPLQQRVNTTILSPDFAMAFFNRHDADEAIAVILQVFSIIMVCRSFAIIFDKDTVLSTVPAFCVLVLLIVVERRPGVVFFFVLWAAAAAVLFALDHRQETSRRAAAVVPALVPGQNTVLSARTLGGLMAFSVLCAAILSYFVTSRIENRSAAEGWIAALAGKLTQFASTLPEVSVNAGPERQIDFTSGPALPTRATLWAISARDMKTGAILHPNYWRLFTLAHYSGTGWTPASDRPLKIRAQALGDVGLFGQLPHDEDSSFPGGNHMRRGYVIERHLASATPAGVEFGVPTRRVRLRVKSSRENLGYLPHLPSTLYTDNVRPDYVSIAVDRSIDTRMVGTNQVIRIVSAVPPTDDYGIGAVQPPSRRSEHPNPAARLSPQERRLYLQLPAGLKRMREFAAQVTSGAPPDASDFVRARRLAEVVEKSATYTLSPPRLPTGRDATEYFLFESRRGYCTYFAGALAIACRCVGIPARVVSGFTAGELHNNGIFEVRESNAHAWTEVWVPDWGWATLDATPAADRGDNAADWWTNWAEKLTQFLDASVFWFAAHRVRLMLLGLLAVFVGLSLLREKALLPARRLTSLRLRRRVSDTAARAQIDEVYERVAHALEKRFRSRPSWETPHEWLDAANAALELQNPAPLRRLTDLFIQARYSPRPLGAQETEEAWRTLGEVRWDKVKS